MFAVLSNKQAGKRDYKSSLREKREANWRAAAAGGIRQERELVKGEGGVCFCVRQETRDPSSIASNSSTGLKDSEESIETVGNQA